MTSYQLPFSLFCISDIHLEIQDDMSHHKVKKIVNSVPKTNVCVLAGDIGDPQSPHFIRFLELCVEKFDHVIFVSGNHELWTTSRPELRQLVESLQVVYLDGDTWTYEGITFYGAPMFTRLDDEDRNNTFRMNDFAQIENMSFEMWNLWHEEYRAKLAQVRATKLVVITHHAPTNLCIPLRYAGSSTNRFYACNLEQFMRGPDAPIAWICGHTHFPLCQTVKQTLVVNNPYLDTEYGVRLQSLIRQNWWSNV